MNVCVYREEQDDAESESWQVVVRNRDDLVKLIEQLQESKSSVGFADSRSVTPSIASSRCDTPSEPPAAATQTHLDPG